MTSPYWQGSWRCRGQSFIVAGVIRASTWVFLALQAHKKETKQKASCQKFTIARWKTRHWEQQKLSQQAGTTVSGCWSRGSWHESSLMPERGDFALASLPLPSPHPPAVHSSSSRQHWSSFNSSIIWPKSFMWKDANQMGQMDCFLPRLSADLTHWDLWDTCGSERRVNRASTNVNPLSAVDKRLEQLPVPCVTAVSVRTGHVLHSYIRGEKAVRPAVTASAPRPALTEADRTVALPCGACPGSSFEQFQSCCAAIPVGAHEHS